MKNTIIGLVLSIFAVYPSSEGHTQVIVDGININELEFVKMCRVLTIHRLFSNKVLIEIDYGQAISKNDGRNSKVSDERTGKSRKFNSDMDAINYMENKTSKHSSKRIYPSFQYFSSLSN